jgi:methylated-DNA-[protein]-cysteine S-methyltransferase
LIANLLYSTTDSPLGPLTLAGTSDALVYLRFPEGGEPIVVPDSWRRDDARFLREKEQLSAYFGGEFAAFDLPLDLRGTDFKLKVWRELLRIPFGEVITYGELARRIGQPEGAQAVGNANGQNPIPIIVPCHRVIAAKNNIGGFTGGVAKKELLLKLEKAKNVQFSLF